MANEISEIEEKNLELDEEIMSFEKVFKGDDEQIEVNETELSELEEQLRAKDAEIARLTADWDEKERLRLEELNKPGPPKPKPVMKNYKPDKDDPVDTMLA